MSDDFKLHFTCDHYMNTAKDRLIKMIDEVSDPEVGKIPDFTELLKV